MLIFRRMLVGFVIFYLLLNLVVGWWASKRIHNTQDFVLAGRSLPFALATMVTFATWFGSETILGAPREFVHGGLLAVVEEPFGAALGLFIVGAIYAKKLYPLPVLTFSDYFRIRFGLLSEKISALATETYLKERAERATQQKFEAALAVVPSQTPDAHDVM